MKQNAMSYLLYAYADGACRPRHTFLLRMVQISQYSAARHPTA